MLSRRTAVMAPAQRGVTLIELMIATTISLLILAAMTGVFVATSRSRAEIDRANEEVENGRYAMQIMSDDLQLAGYWAEFNIMSSPLTVPATLPNPCTDASTAANLTALQNAMRVAVQGYDQTNALTCISDVKANTDVIVIRRVSSCVAAGAAPDPDCGPYAGAPYFQASSCSNSTELNAVPATLASQIRLNTDTTQLTLHKRGCATVADQHQFLVHIYYVANNDHAGDGIPTLKRAELGAGAGAAAWTIVSIATGVEDLQIGYGMNLANDHMETTGHRMPTVFSADPINKTYPASPPPPAAACLVAPCVTNFANTTAVQLNLLVRNPTLTAGYTDTKTYTLGTDAAGNPYTVGPKSDPYRRHAYTQAVMLMNQAIR